LEGLREELAREIKKRDEESEKIRGFAQHFFLGVKIIIFFFYY